MTNPLVPNYKRNVGRLATDRFDFEDHIEGKNFRHKANQIDIFPTLVIGGTSKINVQDALSTLAELVGLPPPDATISSKGIIQLSGDIAGTAVNLKVIGLQQRPISTLAPSNGNVLTWSSSGGNWTPAPPANTFTAGGDLAGNNVSQQVINISGSSGIVNVLCSIVTFGPSVIGPSIGQTASSSNGQNMFVAAQSSTGISGSGGLMAISGGAKGVFGTRGGALFGMNNGEVYPVQAIETTSNNRVLALAHPSIVSSSDMPANTGDLVIFIADTATPPTSGVPSNGTILYSSGSQLFVKQHNGDNFAVGSLSNPSIWGASGQQTYSSRSYVNTVGPSQSIAFDFVPPINAAIQVEAVVVGKATGSTDSQQYRMINGFVTDGVGTVSLIGSVVNSDIRQVGTWLASPQIITSGGHIQVKTGGASGIIVAQWFSTVKLTISTA